MVDPEVQGFAYSSPKRALGFRDWNRPFDSSVVPGIQFFFH